MNKRFTIVLVFVLGIFFSGPLQGKSSGKVNYDLIFANMQKEVDALYGSLEDLKNPTLNDYKKVEEYLLNGNRPFLNEMEIPNYSHKTRTMRLTSEEGEVEYKIVPVNCSLEDKNNCIVLYATCNQLFPDSLRTLLAQIENSNFVGHVIFRIGGYPNQQNGDLALSHVPYSFKVCALMEAYQLGYKRALWLDASMRLKADLNQIFKRMENLGFFSYWDTGHFTVYCGKEHHYKLIGLSKKQAQKLFTVVLGIVGIDFTSSKGLSILHDWYYETKFNPKSSFTSFMETTVLSIIVNKYYKKQDFTYFLEHVYCDQHIKFALIGPDSEGTEFTYNKKDVEPNWPNL
ncbi:hypothetical protein K0U07_00430 [bacterium]|nr:hypothetical protein [bacterium]